MSDNNPKPFDSDLMSDIMDSLGIDANPNVEAENLTRIKAENETARAEKETEEPTEEMVLVYGEYRDGNDDEDNLSVGWHYEPKSQQRKADPAVLAAANAALEANWQAGAAQRKAEAAEKAQAAAKSHQEFMARLNKREADKEMVAANNAEKRAAETLKRELKALKTRTFGKGQAAEDAKWLMFMMCN